MSDENASLGGAPRPKPQENYQVATEYAFERLSRQSSEQFRWLGAMSLDGNWKLPVLNDFFEVRLSSREVIASNGKEVGPAWRILALHYLAAEGVPSVPHHGALLAHYPPLALPRSVAPFSTPASLVSVDGTTAHFKDSYRRCPMLIPRSNACS